MKRFLDIIVSLVLILILFPLFISLPILIKMKIDSPVFFKQKRPSLNEKVFLIYKFRTMTDELNTKGELLPDEIRLVPFGKFMRRFSLDELPQLWNVLKGDMSLVGPRPLLVEYLPLYNNRQGLRHNVRPGITGWAQVNGRNAISWEQKFELDVWYVENQSFWLDMKILVMTVLKVFKTEGISHDGMATMTKFQGSPKSTNEGRE